MDYKYYFIIYCGQLAGSQEEATSMQLGSAEDLEKLNSDAMESWDGYESEESSEDPQIWDRSGESDDQRETRIQPARLALPQNADYSSARPFAVPAQIKGAAGGDDPAAQRRRQVVVNGEIFDDEQAVECNERSPHRGEEKFSDQGSHGLRESATVKTDSTGFVSAQGFAREHLC
jgi:hypothetical protein